MRNVKERDDTVALSIWDSVEQAPESQARIETLGLSEADAAVSKSHTKQEVEVYSPTLSQFGIYLKEMPTQEHESER